MTGLHDAVWLTFLLGTVSPLVLDFVVRRYAPQWLKASTLACLAAANGIVTDYLADGDISSTDSFIRSVIAVVIAVAAHFGLLKPTKVTGNDGHIQQKQPRGIG